MFDAIAVFMYLEASRSLVSLVAMYSVSTVGLYCAFCAHDFAVLKKDPKAYYDNIQKKRDHRYRMALLRQKK